MASFDSLHVAVPRDQFSSPHSVFKFVEAVNTTVRHLHIEARPDLAVGNSFKLNSACRVDTSYSYNAFSCRFHEPVDRRVRDMSIYFFPESDEVAIPKDCVDVCYHLGDFGISEELLRALRKQFPEYQVWLKLDRHDTPEKL